MNVKYIGTTYPRSSLRLHKNSRDKQIIKSNNLASGYYILYRIRFSCSNVPYLHRFELYGFISEAWTLDGKFVYSTPYVAIYRLYSEFSVTIFSMKWIIFFYILLSQMASNTVTVDRGARQPSSDVTCFLISVKHKNRSLEWGKVFQKFILRFGVHG